MTTAKKLFIGGQAIIEGVMMKGPTHVAAAVRTPKGIKTIKQQHTSLTHTNAFFRLPFIRGIIFLFEMLIVGLKMLSWSANQQGEEDDLSGWAMAATMIFSFGVAIVLFVLVPYGLSRIFFEASNIWFHLLDGVLRLGIFLGYIASIGLMHDVKRLFQYHGAEHKAVHCYEAELPLTVKNVQKFSTIHPRCGTSLIVFVIAVSIVVFSIVRFDVWYLNILTRIIAIPLIGGISYEILKWTGTSKNPFLRAIAAPGMWVQQMTTRKPNDKQVEVAIAALKQVL